MKIAIISDIHANHTALTAVIAHARAQGVDQFLCLGDIVGYGPDPAQCVSEIQALGCPVIRGNHDHDAASDRVLHNLNDVARTSLEWTRKQLSGPQRAYLGNLPFIRRIGRFSIAHSSLFEPEVWHYVRGLQDAEHCLTLQDVPLCFIGHTHRPGYFEKIGDGVTHDTEPGSHVLAENARTLVNVGSVGQPRNGDPRASYVIFDRLHRSIEFQRVAYQVQATQQRLMAHGLPQELIERLTEAA